MLFSSRPQTIILGYGFIRDIFFPQKHTFYTFVYGEYLMYKRYQMYLLYGCNG